MGYACAPGCADAVHSRVGYALLYQCRDKPLLICLEGKDLMPLVGNLRDFALHDFLYLVDRGYKTGGLLLDQATSSDAAHLYFDKGKLLSVIRPHRRERLGEMLLRLGKVNSQQLAEALHMQQAGQARPLGQLLVEQGAIAQHELQTCIQQQIEETVYDLFAWREAEFKFLTGQRPALDDVQSLVPLPVENIIMEGVRRVDELSRIRERIPSNDLLVCFVEQPQDKATKVNMTADEWRIFARINGRTTINQIAEKTGMSAFQVSHIVFGFITAGLVEVQKPSPVIVSIPQITPTAEVRPAAPTSAEPASIDAPKKNLVNRLVGRIRGN